MPAWRCRGGGANGAFGAGFLSGWTATGKRPVFKIVTGVSTGALMAPFAFIGPPYDQALRDFYTTTRSRDIFLLGSTFGLLWQLMAGEALADTRPLQTRAHSSSSKNGLPTLRAPRFPRPGWAHHTPIRRSWDTRELEPITPVTSAIESLNSTIRRSVRARGHVPSEEAAIKLIWLRLREVTKNLKMPAREWRAARAQFGLLCSLIGSGFINNSTGPRHTEFLTSPA
jgi:hypothetical protein